MSNQFGIPSKQGSMKRNGFGVSRVYEAQGVGPLHALITLISGTAVMAALIAIVG